MPTKTVEKINLKYLQTEEVVRAKEIRQEAKDIVEVQRDFLRTVMGKFESLGLKQESFFIKADNQEAWDRFVAWQKDACEVIILTTYETGLGTHLGVNVIYKPKRI